MDKEFRVPAYVVTVQKTVPKQDVTRVVVHSGVTAIEADAFRDWTSLEAVVFEGRSRLERIGDHAFAGTALREFSAPGSLKKIGAGAFADCKSLKQVRLNEGLESLGGEGDGAFQGSGLEAMRLPSSLKRMGQNTFAGCANLKRLEMGIGYGDMKVSISTGNGALAIDTECGVKEESSDSVQIEVEDTEFLRKRLDAMEK